MKHLRACADSIGQLGSRDLAGTVAQFEELVSLAGIIRARAKGIGEGINDPISAIPREPQHLDALSHEFDFGRSDEPSDSLRESNTTLSALMHGPVVSEPDLVAALEQHRRASDDAFGRRKPFAEIGEAEVVKAIERERAWFADDGTSIEHVQRFLLLRGVAPVDLSRLLERAGYSQSLANEKSINARAARSRYRREQPTSPKARYKRRPTSDLE